MQKQEFLANHKNSSNTKSFKSVLKTLPEGVALIDGETSKLSFINKKILNTFDFSNYAVENSHLDEIKEFRRNVETEFQQIMQNASKENFSIDSSSSSQETIGTLLTRFKVELKLKEKQNRVEERKDFEEDNIHEMERGNARPSLSLQEFLEAERRELVSRDIKEKQTELQIFWDRYENMAEEARPCKQYTVKTRKVLITNDLNQSKLLFLHMFTDNTKVCQLEETRAQNRYQKQMLANVSHEFRTPLNAILMSLKLMKDTVNEQSRKFLQIANLSSNILASLVEDILDHAKIEAGSFEIQDDVFSLAEMTEEVAGIFELQTQHKQLALKVDLDRRLANIHIKSDKQRLKQVVLSLISNALKFTDQGGIFLSIQCLEEEKELDEDSNSYFDYQSLIFNENDTPNRPNQIPGGDSNMAGSRFNRNKMQQLKQVGNSDVAVAPAIRIENLDSDFEDEMLIKVSVRDTGIGIPLPDQGSLFKLFGKVGANHNRNKTGCGLGLTICKMIVEKLGGRIYLESEPGLGTKVSFWFTCKH